MRQLITCICLFAPFLLPAQDTAYINVHFLYGSKPLKQYRNVESKWFGGVLGGHVGVESQPNQILNFLPKGKFHWFAKKHNRHSTYAVHTANQFYGILGGHPDSAKKTIVRIPVTARQKQLFDSLSTAYLQATPYDYALFGMRCGSAAYDILGKMGIMRPYRYRKTYRKIFYPKRLRKRLLKKAAAHGWLLTRQDGSARRRWERD